MAQETPKKINETQKNCKPVTLIANSFKKSENPIFISIVKVLFTYLITFSTVMCFVVFYDIPYSFSTAIQQVILFVTALFPLLTFVKKRYVLPSLLAFSAIIFYFFRKSIISSILLFKDFLLIRIDSRLLSTLSLVSPDSVALSENTQNFASGMNTAMLIIIGAISLICVLCIYRKFRIIALSIMWVILYGFAFAAERADFTIFAVILMASVAGMYASSTSNDIFIRFSSTADSDKTANNKKRQNKKADKSTAKNSLENIGSTVAKYGKNSLTGTIVLTITLIAAIILNMFIPGNSSLPVDNIINAIVKAASDLGELFSLSFGEAEGNFNGYFSSDNFYINNDIMLNAPPKNGEKVLSIESNTPGTKYLIGDIGVNFSGKSWDSLYKLCEKNEYLINENDTISDSFVNEQIFQIFTYAAQTSGIGNVAKYSNINIEYLKNTDIVFKPYMPGVLEYLSSDNFSFYGDSILRISGERNWIKGFICSTIAPDSYENILRYFDKGITIDDSYILYILSKMAYSKDFAVNYIADKNIYDQYVSKTYLEVPDFEKENIRRLLDDYRNSDYFRFKNDGYDGYLRNINAFAFSMGLSEYLQNNFTYSLETENAADDNNTLLGNFLFKTKSGHCALYASSMVLALRESGIPARYVTGFAARKSELDEKSQEYVYTVKENNLHAWVEAYFDDLGWIVFDPTAAAFTSDEQSGNDPTTSVTTTTPPPVTTLPSTTNVTTPVATTTTAQTSAPHTEITSAITTGSKPEKPSPEEDNQQNKENEKLLRIIIIAALIVISLVGLILFAFYSVKKKHERRKTRFRKSDAGDAVREMYRFALSIYAEAGITPNKYELPMDFATRADELTNASSEGKDIRFAEIMPIFEKSEFSKSEITEEERSAAISFVNQLYSYLLLCSGKIKRLYLKIKL